MRQDTGKFWTPALSVAYLKEMEKTQNKGYWSVLSARARSVYKKNWRFSFALLYAIMSIYVLLELKNHRFHMSDFHVYYVAASRIVHGENLYRPVEDGFYHFKYSPTSALFFVPFSFLPPAVAQTVYWFFLSFMVCLGLYLSLLMIAPRFKVDDDAGRINNIILLTALLTSVHVSRELELGQVNQLLFVLYIIAAYFLSRGKDFASALFLAASLFLKPFALIFLPWLLLRKKWKLIMFCILFAVVFAALPVLFTGGGLVLSQYQGWFQEMAIELSHKQSLLAHENHTIFSLIARYTPLRHTRLVIDRVALFQGVVLVLIAAGFYFFVRRGKSLERAVVSEWAILIGLIPLLSFTSHNAFGFEELAVVILLYYFKDLPLSVKIFAVAGMIATGGNIYDIVGRKLWFIINDLSVVGIGAALLIASLTAMRQKRIC
jgi:Glycosyltransferase family 87